MKKRLTVLLCLLLSLLLLTGCASKDISKAKTAYANGDYQTVVDLLENMKNPKPEVAELLNNAKIHLAFDEPRSKNKKSRKPLRPVIIRRLWISPVTRSLKMRMSQPQ